MNKFKGLKKVTALALCGIMCLGSVMTASAYSSTRYVTDGAGNMLSTVYLTKNGESFSAEMVVEKKVNGNNMYSGKVDVVTYVEDKRDGGRKTFNYTNSVNIYTANNAIVSDKYTDYIINYVGGTATTNYSKISLNFYQ